MSPDCFNNEAVVEHDSCQGNNVAATEDEDCVAPKLRVFQILTKHFHNGGCVKGLQNNLRGVNEIKFK